jgi:acetyl esterase/lipase
MKVLKRIGYGLVIVLLTFSALMLIPRTYSLIFPDKPPMGYHFLWSTYLAVAIGLEDIIEKFTDIVYKTVDSTDLQLDLYRPHNAAPNTPLLVFIHGGGWRKGHRADMIPLIVDFLDRGYVCATVSYRLRNTYPSCVDDMSDAVDWFFAHGDEYGYDPDRIALVGASAGAHLAMMAGYGWRDKPESADSTTSKHRIKAIVNIFGAVDLTTDFGRNHPLVTVFMNKTYAEAPELYLEASPIIYIDNNSPPTLTLHGTSDELVPVSQADQLKNRLDSLGVPCVDYRFPLWPHAMVLVQRVYDYCFPKMDEFLAEHLLARKEDDLLPNNQ